MKKKERWSERDKKVTKKKNGLADQHGNGGDSRLYPSSFRPWYWSRGREGNSPLTPSGQISSPSSSSQLQEKKIHERILKINKN